MKRAAMIGAVAAVVGTQAGWWWVAWTLLCGTFLAGTNH
jgi:hypothetical protein